MLVLDWPPSLLQATPAAFPMLWDLVSIPWCPRKAEEASQETHNSLSTRYLCFPSDREVLSGLGRGGITEALRASLSEAYVGPLSLVTPFESEMRP
jgi:hypothetical protein